MKVIFECQWFYHICQLFIEPKIEQKIVITLQFAAGLKMYPEMATKMLSISLIYIIQEGILQVVSIRFSTDIFFKWSKHFFVLHPVFF